MAIYDPGILSRFLGPEQPFDFKGSTRYSTLVAGLRDCRVYAKRDVSTGKHDLATKFGNEGNWLGAIGYFTVLYQMGSCYCPANGSRTLNNATIPSAIEDFGFDLLDHDQHQLNALIALRNAFTHDFNLFNIPQNHKKNRFNSINLLLLQIWKILGW